MLRFPCGVGSYNTKSIYCVEPQTLDGLRRPNLCRSSEKKLFKSRNYDLNLDETAVLQVVKLVSQ